MDVISNRVRNAEIEKLHREGVTYASLARRFGLSYSRVRQIVARGVSVQKAMAFRFSAPLRHVR